ncbi:MAG: FkbM family methyltransferase [Planctomycetota bacterium]
MIRAIDDFPSFFEVASDDPLIIDCGANIGVSVLEWKSRWPMAQVLCFEPDPDAFRLLEMNIERNDVPGVRCIHAAVTDFAGEAAWYGDLGKGADARGNSLRPEWGKRSDDAPSKVPCKRLSSFLQGQRVSFLKLDIEGAEEAVLRDIAEHLHLIDAMYVEVHENDLLDEWNSLQRIMDCIRGSGLKVEEEPRYQPHSLPPAWSAWGNQWNARQTQLLCYRG